MLLYVGRLICQWLCLGPVSGTPILSIKPKTFVFQIPGADALGHFSLLLDEDLAAQHEQHRQNRNKNKQL